MKRHALHLMALLSFTLAVALLAPRPAAADDDDPPGRVARLAYIQGTVSFEPAGTDDWVSAAVNRPLTTGDKLWNDNDSLSELNMGSATIRLGSNTGFSFLNLTDNMAQIQLTEGTLNIRVRRLDDDETFEVDTPNLAFTLLRPGNYKINVNEAGDATVVLVRAGQGEVTGGGSAYNIHPREVGTFTGTDQIDADVQAWDDTSDDFDNWCSDRDSRIEHSVSARYVSDDVIGYEDLDEYGGWRQTHAYGAVWFPRVTIAGWAPYHYGHWVYIAPWGYTWVDDAPWGFAPFHYGRWVTVGGVWGWVPAPPRPTVVGVAYVRPVYAPALVAWVGGSHFAVGIGVGGGASVGWFPLGPREVYVPSYHVSRNYVTNINVSNTRVETTVVNNYYNTTVINKNVTNVTYINQRVPGAVVATSHDAFISARSVSRNSVIINQREVTNARVGFAAPAVAPSRQAVLGAAAVVRARPPIVMENRVVVVRHAPPPPPPSFDREQQAIRANGGRPLAVSQIRQIEPERVQARSNIRIAPVATQHNMETNKMVEPNPNRDARPNSYRNAESNPNRDSRPNSYRDARPNSNRDAEANPNRDARPNPYRNAEPNPNHSVSPANAVNQNGNSPVTGTHERIYTDRPVTSRPNLPANANNPGNPANAVNQNGNSPVTGTHERIYTDRPVTSRPNLPANANNSGNPANAVNQNGNSPVTGTHERIYTDRPVTSRPNSPANANNPGNPANAVNQNGNSPVTGTHERIYTDRPVTSRPNSPANANNPINPTNVNPQFDQRRQQAPQNLRTQQDQERQRTQQQPRDGAAFSQNPGNNRAQQQPTQQQLNQQQPTRQQLNQQQPTRQQINQQHPQQPNQQPQQRFEPVERKQVIQQQKPVQQQQVEKRQEQKPAKPPKAEKPQKNN